LSLADDFLEHVIVLSLRPTVINGNRYADDFCVWWRSRQFGRRRIGRIMKAHGRPFGSPDWSYHITAGLPVRSGNGMAESLDQAKLGFRKAFERFESETPDRVFARLYECVPSMRDRRQKGAWLAKFDDPIPLPGGGWIKTLSDARAHMLTLSEREQLEERWQDAARYVLKAVEERPFIFFVRLAVYKAVHRSNDAMPPAPDVKKPDTWRERRRAARKADERRPRA
jgi:hypothetical protein